MLVETNSPSPAAPAILGSYELVRLLGEGSMGQVYQARHTILGRNVAIKILRPELTRDRAIVQRFLQEARTINEINHENIVEVFDYVEDGDGGRVWFVMELLQGRSLKTLLNGKIPVLRGVEILRQICSALAGAHRLGVVHRDLKPDNIFVCPKDGRDWVKVLDFGVAKLLHVLSGAALCGTVDGAIIGTPTYMSPEQAAGTAVDHRSDLYALGTIAYEMLTGSPPFDCLGFGKLFVQIITQAPPRLGTTSVAGERIPPDYAELVMRCLEKDRARRPQSAEEIGAILGGLFAQRAPRRRSPAVVAGIGAAAAMVVAGATWGLWLRPESAATTGLAAAQVPIPAPALVTLAAVSSPPGGRTIWTDTGEATGNEPAERKATLSTISALEVVPAPVSPAPTPAKVEPKPIAKKTAAKIEGVSRDGTIDAFAQ